MYTLSTEQKSIINKIEEIYKNKEKNNLIKIDAKAGTGKTSTLISIVEHLNNIKRVSGRYLVFGKANSEEAKERFAHLNIDCSTLHSMAIRSIKSIEDENGMSLFPIDVCNGNIKPGMLNKTKILYKYRYQCIKLLEKFYVSESSNFDVYSKKYTKEMIERIDSNDKIENKEEMISEIPKVIEGSRKIWDMSRNGIVPISHNGYLKMFHILCKINPDTFLPKSSYDIVMLDEAGDVNEVMLDIFRLLKAKVKVIVGDKNQNIYGFNDTVNGFEILKDEGYTFSLSKSYRVPSHIAKQVESFGSNLIDPNFKFSGVNKEPITDESYVPTKAMISRTNGFLIDNMINLYINQKKFRTFKNPYEIFMLPHALFNINKPDYEYPPELAWLEKDVNKFYASDDLQAKYEYAMSYIADAHKDDVEIKAAINIVNKLKNKFKDLPPECKTYIDNYGNIKSIGSPAYLLVHISMTASKYFKEHKQGVLDKDHTLLMTGHTSKGLEVDNVTISEDMHTVIEKRINDFGEMMNDTDITYDNLFHKDEMQRIKFYNKLPKSILEEFNLYYVACTRSMRELHNAKLLTPYMGFD